jgi:hypothetical protein
LTSATNKSLSTHFDGSFFFSMLFEFQFFVVS